MKKSTKALSAILSLSSVASVVAPVTTMAAASIDTLIATAEKSKSFYDFNQVYAALQKLPAASKAKYTAKVNELAGKVQQYADVIALLEKEVAFGKSGNAADFNAILAEINAKISNATDKKYLTDELGAWGNKMLAAQPGYSAATDAIIAAWTSLASNDVDAIKAAVAKAKEAVAKLSHEANKTYLTKDITTVETKLAAIEAAQVVKLDSVKAVGAKKLEVKFSKAVDTAKAALTVKKGTVAVNTDKVEFSADKKTATITTTTNLTKGDYTVSVAGLTETALTGVASVEDVKVSKINITTTKAPRMSTGVNPEKRALVTYEVLNQYGEKMTNQNVSWTISTGHAVENESTANGTFEIRAAGTTDFIPGSIVYITGVHAASGTVVNSQVEIALAAQADTLTFKGVWDRNNSKFVDLPAGFATAGATSGRYVILYQVKDQYGNTMSNPDLSKLVFTSNNPLFVASVTTRTAIAVDGVTYEALDLVAGTAVNNGGSVTLQAISTVTGKVSTYTAQAEALSAVKTFTMSAPTSIVAEGEDVEIPFAAEDQYGKAITKYSTLVAANISLSPASSAEGTLEFVEQNDGSAKLIYHATSTTATSTSDKMVYLTSVVPNGGSFSSLMLNVKDTAIPTAIIGLDSDKATSIAKGNSTDIKAENLVVQDQYGRTMTDTKVNQWLNNGANSIVVTSDTANGTFTVSKYTNTTLIAGDTNTQVIDGSTDLVRIASVANATTTSENITFTLATNNNGTAGLVDSSAKLFTFANVDKSAYASYEVADLGKMYNDGVDNTTASSIYNKTVKVYGVKADGTKVLLPASDYSVTVDTAKLRVVNGNEVADVVSGGYHAANGDLTESGSAKDATVTVLVTVNDTASGSAIAILSKDLTVSRVAQKVATVTFKSDKVTAGKATVNTTGSAITTAILTNFIDTVKDQYGVDRTEAPKVTITNLTKVDGSTFTVADNGLTTANITNARLGDKFTVTYKYASGVSVTLDLTVGLPQ